MVQQGKEEDGARACRTVATNVKFPRTSRGHHVSRKQPFAETFGPRLVASKEQQEIAASTDGLPKRRRLYTATIVFMLALAVALVLPNVMGDVVVSPDAHWQTNVLYQRGVSPHLEHGWPLVYLWRKPPGINKRAIKRNYTLWGVYESIRRFSPERLWVNFAVGVAMVVGGGWLFNRWLAHRSNRGRRRLWQFGLGELAIGVAILGAALGFIARERYRHARELGALNEMLQIASQEGRSLAIEQRIAVAPSGPTWLRDLLGDAPFAGADAVVELRDLSVQEMQLVDRFPRLTSVSCNASFGPVDLSKLASCTRLERLEAENSFPTEIIRVPPLPRLRGLFVSRTRARIEGIGQLPNLEVLDATRTSFDDEAAKHLPGLQRLETLLLERTLITDAALPALKNCRGLKTLSLPDAMSEEAVRELREALPNCQIRYRGQEFLAQRPLHETD